MNKVFTTILILISPVLLTGQVAINTTGIEAPQSAMLSVSHGSKGFLPPRMTQSQRDAISSPATGLLIYQTDGTGGYYYYDGTAWKTFSPMGWSLTGNSGTIDGTDFVGNTSNVYFNLRIDSIRAGRIDQARKCTWLGYKSGDSANLSSQYTALGNYCGGKLTNVNYGTAIGAYAFKFGNNGNSITAIGDSALHRNEEGNGNVAVGYKAMSTNKNSQYNVVVGVNALGGLAFTNSGNAWDGKNTAIGNEALKNCNSDDVNLTGIYNTAIGDSSLYTLRLGAKNSAAGFLALFKDTTGKANTGCGYQALYRASTGHYNTAFGYYALADLTTGSGNTGIGAKCGTIFNGITTSDYGSVAGYDTRPNFAGIDNFINFDPMGISDYSFSSNMARFGNYNTTSIGGQVSWTSYSDERIKENIQENVPGIKFIMKLTPVTYQMKKRGNVPEKGKRARYMQIRRTGFLAQEVEAAAGSVGFDFDGVDTPPNEKGYYGLRYALFTVPLVKAVQEHQQELEKTEAELSEIIKDIEELKQLFYDVKKIKKK